MSLHIYFTYLTYNHLACNFSCSPLPPVCPAALCSQQASEQTTTQPSGTLSDQREPHIPLSSHHCPRSDGVTVPSCSCHKTLNFISECSACCPREGGVNYLVSVKCLEKREVIASYHVDSTTHFSKLSVSLHL